MDDKRIKLLMLTVGLGVGGTEGQILEISSRLDRGRFDVTVCGLKGDDIIARELRSRGIRVITLDGRRMWNIGVLYKLLRVMRGERPEIVHAFLFWANVASRVVGRLLRVPVLISSYRSVGAWTTWHRRVLDRLTARLADAMTCCSEAVRQLAVAHLGGRSEKYVTIHNGVDVQGFDSHRALTRSELGLREGDRVIGTVCRLIEPMKGLSVLLHALSRLVGSSALPPCQLLIVGEGPAFTQLRCLSQKLGIDPCVVFAGARRDIPSVLSQMEVFVLPSLYEGFGIAIVEAMAAGRPVVATAVGGIPEIVIHGETGLLVPAGDPLALSAAIQDLLSHPAKARMFGERGQRRARERFAIESVVKRHEELYETLLAQRTCARDRTHSSQKAPDLFSTSSDA